MFCLYKWWLVATGLLTVAIALGLIRPWEGGAKDWLHLRLAPAVWQDPTAWISWSGEFLFHLVGFLGFWLLGLLRKSRRMQVLAVCILVSVIGSSVVARAGKFSFGRLRPIVAERNEVPDTFIGPTLKPKYHSFPSGHTAAAFATATPVLLACPPAGIPFTAYATLIAASRTYQNQHYLSDLFAGLIIGIVFSLPTSRLLKDIRKAQNHTQ